jgi:hypothetical protein
MGRSERVQGTVVFISGNAAVIPKAGATAVGAINAAIEALAKAFAERGIEDGVSGQQRFAGRDRDGLSIVDA